MLALVFIMFLDKATNMKDLSTYQTNHAFLKLYHGIFRNMGVVFSIFTSEVVQCSNEG